MKFREESVQEMNLSWKLKDQQGFAELRKLGDGEQGGACLAEETRPRKVCIVGPRV